jgi:hypothetical protein
VCSGGCVGGHGTRTLIHCSGQIPVHTWLMHMQLHTLASHSLPPHLVSTSHPAHPPTHPPTHLAVAAIHIQGVPRHKHLAAGARGGARGGGTNRGPLQFPQVQLPQVVVIPGWAGQRGGGRRQEGVAVVGKGGGGWMSATAGGKGGGDRKQLDQSCEAAWDDGRVVGEHLL